MDKKSESYALLKFIWGIITLPFVLILVLIGKKKPNDIFKPFKELLTNIIRPKFTVTIIIINIFIFIFMFFLPESLIESLIFYPSNLFTTKIYTIITSGFLHANLAHLLGNLLAIYIFGRVVELQLGKGKTIFIYFSAMILAGIVFGLSEILIFKSNPGAVGASGALMGIVATAILIKPFTLVYELLIPIPVLILGWLAIWADITGILSGSRDGIGHFAHLGGFLTIFVLMPFLKEKKKLVKGLIVNIITLIIFLLLWFIFLR